MRTALIAIAALAAVPALAGDLPASPAAASLHSGQMLRDANNMRIGAITAVNPDGSVGLIVDSRYVVIPASSLNVVDGKPMTKLTKREVASL